MKFIKDINNSLINLDHVSYIFINDRGKDYTKPFEIVMNCPTASYSKGFVLAEFEFEDMADKYLHDLFNDISKKC